MRMRLTAIVLLSALAPTALGGCTKLAPASVTDFGAEKTVVVTLRDGEQLKGKITVGQPVSFTTIGRVYRAEVEDIDDNGNIVLANAYVQEEYERFDLQRERLSGSVLHVRDDTHRISIPAHKIVSVEEVKFDRARSGQVAGFWGFTLFVMAKIMSARL